MSLEVSLPSFIAVSQSREKRCCVGEIEMVSEARVERPDADECDPLENNGMHTVR